MAKPDEVNKLFPAIARKETNLRVPLNQSSTANHTNHAKSIAARERTKLLERRSMAQGVSPDAKILWNYPDDKHFGYPPPVYQWRFNGTSILTATNSSYTIPSSSITNVGYYDVVVANLIGTNTSVTVSLTFLDLKMFAGLIINGPIGANYNVQAIPALGGTNWTTLTNVTLSTQPYIYIDYNSPTNSKQFYRVVPLP